MNAIIGYNLKKLRELSGYTQDEVAQALGITRSAYSNYEGGTREFPYDLLEKAADLFGCDLSLFFEENIHADDLLLVSAFRLNELSSGDMAEIIRFKGIVKSYLKMNQTVSK